MAEVTTRGGDRGLPDRGLLIEEIGGGGGGIGGSIADQQVAFGNGTNITGTGNLTWNDSDKILEISDNAGTDGQLGSDTLSGTFYILANNRLGVGDPPWATSGNLVLPKIFAIRALNHAGDGDLSVLGIGVDGNNFITLGDVNSTYVLLNLNSSAIAIGASSEINISTTNLNIEANVNISSILSLTPTTAPGSPTEGMIYAGTDHHLHYYNGTAWKQLDN